MADIVLKDKQGKSRTYEGVESVSLKTSDGGEEVFGDGGVKVIPLYVSQNGTYTAGEGSAYSPVDVELPPFTKLYTITGTVENPLSSLSADEFDTVIGLIGNLASYRNKCILALATMGMTFTLYVSVEYDTLLASYGVQEFSYDTQSAITTLGNIALGTLGYKIDRENRILTLTVKKMIQCASDGSNFMDMSNYIPNSAETVTKLYRWEQTISS